jgi:DTW domain-containing protein
VVSARPLSTPAEPLPPRRVRPPEEPAFREVCLQCRRPRRACWCPHLAHVESRTRTCFLQHPREGKTAIGTARMAHLSLPNSELHQGVCFEDHPRVRELASRPGTALLFPGEGAIDAATLRERPPEAVIVIDGTWSQAGKVVKANPFLQALPRLSFTPARPSNYRIRREPQDHFVSTIEAVVYLLSALEGDGARYQPILRAFDEMVDLQIAEREKRTGPPRRREKKSARPRVDLTVEALRARPREVVALYAEANGWAIGSPEVEGDSELVQLVAQRPATGELFEALIRPRRKLGPSVSQHLELPAQLLLEGEEVGAALARFERFVRPGDLFCGWGPYAVDLLRAEGAPEREFADLRLSCARRLRRRPGGAEQAVRLLGGASLPASVGRGRAGRRLACLVTLLGQLIEPEPVVPAPEVPALEAPAPSW